MGGTHGDPSIGHWNGAAWAETPTTLVGENSNFLNGVTVITANDIWTVGGYLRYNYIEQRQFHTGEVIRTLVQHWDGSSWSVVPSPNDHPSSSSQDNVLNAVSAISANDIWAVGFVGSHPLSTEHQYQSTPLESLIEHWDGTQWTVVGGLPDTSNLQLFDVEALAPDDVWAVGGTGGQNPGQPALILHWNGVQWSTVANPVSDRSQLNSLDAVSANDIWAAGSRSGSPYVLHWDGTNWTVANNTIEEGLALLSIVAVSSTNVWAVGTSYGTSIYMVHYDGSTWYGTFLPGPGPGPSILNSIVANSDIDIWAAGSYVDADGSQQTLIMHYDGTQWSQVPSPNEGAGDNVLKGLALDGSQNIWAVGNYQTSLAERVLVEHYPTLFADVPVGSTFYPYVQSLACRGIINGYSDGTFHTNNSVTRGQLSKIVSNAAGFNDPPGAQLYEDVSPNSTFYDYIQRLTLHAVMSGYPCGGTGEPCGPGNLPYFRPAANATRGQTSKIVSNTFFPECNIARK